MKSPLDAETKRTATSAEERWATVDGSLMRYLRSGSGPPLVLVHGLLGYSFSWRFAIPVLQARSTIYAVDMPGAGFSDHPRNLDCCLSACAGRLLRFMDSVGVNSCDLLGTSHGGGVVMMAAAIAPDRIRRLILPTPINPWSARGRHFAPFLSTPPIAALFLHMAPHLDLLTEVYVRRLFGDPRRIRPGTVEGYAKGLRRPRAFEYGLTVLRTWNQDLKELERMLPRIANIPTLLIWGSLDAAVYASSAGPLARKFRNCKLVVFDGVGHLPYEEVPEEFNRVVMEFLGANQHDSS